MKELLVYALCLSLIVQFVYACFWGGMIFGKVAGWAMDAKVKNGKLKERVPVWIRKPLFECPICMTPYYSTIIIVIFDLAGWYSWPVRIDIFIVLIASGFSTIFSRLYD